MYSVRVHSACAEEFKQLRAAKPKDAADIFVVLEEVFGDEVVQQAIIQERVEDDIGLIDIARFLDMWQQGDGLNVWRAKVKPTVREDDARVQRFASLPTLQQYRFFFTVNRLKQEIHILAIRPRISGTKGKGDIYARDNELRALLDRRCRDCGGDRWHGRR